MRKIGPLLVVLALLFLAKLWVEPHALKVAAKRPSLDPVLVSVQKTKPTVLGFDQWVAGLIWVNLLQNATTEPVAPGKVSWEYSQLLKLVRLDRKFERAYSFGGSFLSVFRQDKLGAKDILERWVSVRPRYWRSHYTLGFHLYSELNETEAAAAHILKAAEMENAPAYLTSLGVRLLSETGNLAHLIAQTVDLYSTVTTADAKGRLLLRVLSLRYALEKQDWEVRLKEFTKRRRREPASLSEVAALLPRERRNPANLLENQNELDEPLVRALAEPLEFRYDSLEKKIRLTDPQKEKLFNSVGIHRPT